MNINGIKLNHLRFADDLVIFAEDPNTLQKMLQELSDESKKAGLTMNTNKTKIMTNKSEEIIQVGNKKIEYVKE